MTVGNRWRATRASPVRRLRAELHVQDAAAVHVCGADERRPEGFPVECGGSDVLRGRGLLDAVRADGHLAVPARLDHELAPVDLHDSALERRRVDEEEALAAQDRKSTRLNSSHSSISYAVFCL